MNIEDIQVEVDYPNKIILAIFDRQKELMVKYDEIETRNGVHVPKEPYHLDDRRVQYRLKDMFWRFTEELCEASEELIVHPCDFIGLENWAKAWDDKASVRHFFEEIVDALHFLTEASIIANLEPQEIQLNLEGVLKHFDSDGTISMNRARPDMMLTQVPHLFFKTIRSVGLAANCLKNKPWKVSEMITDAARFRLNLYNAWDEFFVMWGELGGSDKMLYLLYTKKNLVNQWRQKTQY